MTAASVSYDCLDDMQFLFCISKHFYHAFQWYYMLGIGDHKAGGAAE